MFQEELAAGRKIEQLAGDLAGLLAQLAGIQTTFDWLKLVGDAKASARRAEELNALTVQAIEAKAAAEQALAGLVAAKTEHDRREASIRNQELEAHTEKQRLEGIRNELVAFARQVRETEDQVKLRLLQHAGLLGGHSPSSRSLIGKPLMRRSSPSPRMLTSMMIPSTWWSVEHASAQATITRSRQPRHEQPNT